MEGWNWLYWSRGFGSSSPASWLPEPEPFSLPAPLPDWPPGGGFAQGRICIGDLEVTQITNFRSIWSCYSNKKKTGATFYEPVGVPDGFHCLGHYSQRSNQPLRGYLLVARDASRHLPTSTALEKPVDYALAWSSKSWDEDGDSHTSGCFWLPLPPDGYKAVGYVVTAGTRKPSLEAVRCVRSDLTQLCEHSDMIVDMESIFPEFACRIWKTRPCDGGIRGTGVSVGTFSCGEELVISCLKNLDASPGAMPNLQQLHALIGFYGPTLFFHPKETYLPSSVPWFFENGATLYHQDDQFGEEIHPDGSNLPAGGSNDGKYWIDLPDDDRRSYVKRGNIASSELYVHVKPAVGRTFTDLAMWVFCPFNGPASIKIGVLSYSFSKIGRHIGDWEHVTLRISNFTGELWSIYFSQHSGGQWVDATDLEFVAGNKAAVYSSKSGHASYPHPGTYLQGSDKLGVGIRNDAARSDFSMDSSNKYRIIAAEHLGDAVAEPAWLQFMREWGPTIRYKSRSELGKLLELLPISMRFSIEGIFNRLPGELCGEEGPTGPKEKNNWDGDERW